MRLLESGDVAKMVQLAVAAEMFPAEAGTFLSEQANGWLERGREPGSWVVDEQGGTVVAVAFFEPRPATDRVWALTMIVVDPTLQGTGLGTKILRWVEAELRRQAQRILVIETSSTPHYAHTRTFYEKNGYRNVATVPDYFEDGDGMVLFLKDLREHPL